MFYDRHIRGLLGYFARRTNDPEVAADLAAETFASALVARRRFRAPAAPGGGLAVHDRARRLADYHRQRPRRRRGCAARSRWSAGRWPRRRPHDPDARRRHRHDAARGPPGRRSARRSRRTSSRTAATARSRSSCRSPRPRSASASRAGSGPCGGVSEARRERGLHLGAADATSSRRRRREERRRGASGGRRGRCARALEPAGSRGRGGLAAAAAAFVLAVLALAPHRIDRAASPQVVATIRVAGTLTAAAYGDGCLWITDFAGTLVRSIP